MIRSLFFTGVLICAGVIITLIVSQEKNNGTGHAFYLHQHLVVTNIGNTMPESQGGTAVGTNTKASSFVACNVTSKIALIDHHSFYRVGERASVRITLYDSTGRRRTIGGDKLRLWAKQEPEMANVAGEVVDNNNGTYTGSVLLPWKGRPTIYVSIAVPQEMQILIYNIIQRNGGSYYPYKGYYHNRQISQKEQTFCGPVFANVDIADLCNFTGYYNGLEWYCLAPKSRKLSCQDWASFKCIREFIGVTETEAAFLRDFHDRKLRDSVTVNVRGETIMNTRDIPCDQRPRKNTWNERPSGFYYNNTWHVIGCKLPNSVYDKTTFQNYEKCLQNRHIIFIGDSNIRTFSKIFIDELDMELVRGDPRTFSFFSFAQNVKKNVSLSIFPHQLPYFYPEFLDRTMLVPTTTLLDDIQAGNNSIILLHMWLHSKMMDPRVFRSHIRQIRKSVEILLKRSPKVDIFIKGPHAVTGHIPPVDYSISEHIRIWNEEFRGLHDKVVFLGMWDMTVGNENNNAHPHCVMDMVYIFLSHICHT